MHNLNAVKQQLWGLEMEAPCAVGDAVTAADGSPLGRVTSYIDTPSGEQGQAKKGPHVAAGSLPARQEGRPAAELRPSCAARVALQASTGPWHT